MLLSKLQMSYYWEKNSHIRNKVKVLLDLPNHAIKKELKHKQGSG